MSGVAKHAISNLINFPCFYEGNISRFQNISFPLISIQFAAPPSLHRWDIVLSSTVAAAPVRVKEAVMPAACARIVHWHSTRVPWDPRSRVNFPLRNIERKRSSVHGTWMSQESTSHGVWFKSGWRGPSRCLSAFLGTRGPRSVRFTAWNLPSHA